MEKLIKNDITLYSAHTNLDFTKDGVSFQLAKSLKLQSINFLENLQSNQIKFSIFVPKKFLRIISDTIFNAGGGIIGEYSNCSFRTEGTGTFKGSKKTNPARGEKEKFEKTEEIKLEVLIDSWKMNKIIEAVQKVHPYEEVAYDVVPLNNENKNYGIGAVGFLEKALPQKQFLEYAAQNIKIKNFRYVNGKKSKIKKVAVCGGSGADYIGAALKSKADAFITADLKYHIFNDAAGEILLIDAGHYETEIHSLNEIERRLSSFIDKKDEKINVYKFRGNTNSILFYNK